MQHWLGRCSSVRARGPALHRLLCLPCCRCRCLQRRRLCLLMIVVVLLLLLQRLQGLQGLQGLLLVSGMYGARMGPLHLAMGGTSMSLPNLWLGRNVAATEHRLRLSSHRGDYLISVAECASRHTRSCRQWRWRSWQRARCPN